MICDTCELEYGDLSQNIGTCPECLRIIIAHSVPDDDEEDDGSGDGEFKGGIVAEEAPDDKGEKQAMTIEDVLREFVEDIESTGGLEWNFEERQYGPVGDPGWTALANTYLHACEVLDREPIKSDGDAADEEEDEPEPDQPEDEDLVTSDYVTFYRFGMGKVAFVVPTDESWEEAAKAYMEQEQYWPDVWLEEERGGYTNITTEGP